MFKAMIIFNRGILKFNWFWKLWLASLVGIVFGWSMLYINSLEGQVVISASALGLVTGLAVVAWEKGFSRLTGLMHWTWFPMVPWLWQRTYDLEGPKATWIWAVIIATTASLVIDTIQVILWIRGKREQTVSY